MIFSVMNLKGGVGKTTTAVNLAYLAGEVKKKRVLLIDNDPQDNASSFFQHFNAGKALNVIISAIIDNDGEVLPIIPAHTQYKKVDIIPADAYLSECNSKILKLSAKEQYMLYIDIIKNIVQKYDLIVIDNAPNITPLTIAALLASEQVIVPVEADKLSIDGLNEIIRQIDNANQGGFKDLKLGGILLTKFNGRTKINNETLEFLKNGQLTGGVKYHVFNTTIRQTVKVKEATFLKKPLELVCRSSNAAKDYRSLVSEILKK